LSADENRPAVMAEVRAAFDAYEAALVRNDIEALNSFFLNSASSVRYGIAEQHYGFEAIGAFRRTAAAVHPQRRLLRTVISSFGAEFASVCCEFTDPSSPRTGRQTQTWVRTADGWRIAAAHVSLSSAPR
jgi:hypothetical protein